MRDIQALDYQNKGSVSVPSVLNLNGLHDSVSSPRT
jgi:hypothetical protein